MGRGWITRCCTFLLFLIPGLLSAASPNPHSELTDRGRPFIRVYTYQDAGTYGHSFYIQQDSRGIIYASNEFGLLEFDGSNWRLYTHPDRLYLVSICLTDSNRIYTGFHSDCGYVEFNGRGPEFVSLSSGIPDSVKTKISPWRIHDTPDGLLYQSRRCIVYLDPADSSSIKHPVIFTAGESELIFTSARLRDRFLFLQRNVGLLELRDRGTSLTLLDTTYKIPTVNSDMIALNDTTVLILVDEGVMLYDGRFHKLPSNEISRFFLEYKGNFLSQVNDSLFVLSSENNGIALFDLTGRIHQHFSKEDGLASDMLWERVLVDRDGGLWLPTDGGITYIEYNSPFSYYDQKDGLDGEQILTITKFAGDHYIGTAKSLFCLKKGPGHGIVELVHNDGYRYISLDAMRDRLIFGNFTGLWELRAGESSPRMIYRDILCNSVEINPDSAGFLARGSSVARWYRFDDNGDFKLMGEINGCLALDLEFSFDGDWGSWTVFVDHPRVQRIRATKKPPESAADFEIVGYDSAEGVPQDFSYGHGAMVDDHRIMQAGEHFLEYDPETDRFYPVELVDPGEEGENKYLYTLLREADGGIWYRKALYRYFRYAFPKGDSYQIVYPLARAYKEIFWNAVFETDPLLIWIKIGSKKLIRYEPDTQLLRAEPPPALIRRFVVDQKLVYGGGAHMKDVYMLPHDATNIQITYSIPHYIESDAKLYNYRLVGYEDEWSDWNDKSVKEYMNLDAGTYRFEVYAMDALGRTSEIAPLSFRIVPPWYLTVWAYGLYLLALVGMVYGVVRIRTHRILVNNVKLQERVDLQTAELTRTVDALNTEVDQRKAVEVERESQRRRLDAIFHGVDEGILSVDERGVIDQLNRTSLDILGVEEKELAGRSFDDAAVPLPEAMVDGIRQCLESGNPIHDFQVTHHRDDENLILVVNISSLPSGEPGKNSVLLVFRDVTRLYQLERKIEERAPVGDMLGVSPAMIRVFNRIDELADTTATVLIQGETGTGKGMVAAALHQNSPRKNGPFVVVNCAALNENLLASELFGHVKGAFTGAINERDGRFQAAAGGTLFLDEIGDISPLMQASLLRVLEKGEYERVGETKVRVTDARIITATNRDLKARIADGRFREDLYYRLDVVSIHIPPLRERKDDLPVYVEHFFDRYRESLNRNCDTIAPETMEMLLANDWPGNVRALENAIRSAIISCIGNVLMPHHFPREVMEAGEANTVSSESPASYAETQRNTSIPSDGNGSNQDNSFNRGRVRDVLNNNLWNVSRAARQLGISRQYLHRLIKQYELKRPD